MFRLSVRGKGSWSFPSNELLTLQESLNVLRVTDYSIRVYRSCNANFETTLGGVAIIHLVNSIVCKYRRIPANSIFLVFDDRVILSGSTPPMDLAVQAPLQNTESC